MAVSFGQLLMTPKPGRVSSLDNPLTRDTAEGSFPDEYRGDCLLWIRSEEEGSDTQPE